MSGRKYIGTIVFNQNIDQYSKSKKDSLKREIYEKMTSNEYFIKNINVGGGQFLSHKNKTIKLKGNKAFVEFKETISPHNDTYKKRSKDKSMFNWAQKNFKRSMNFNKKMFLDDSLKAVKISVKKDIKGGMDLSGMTEKEPENIIIKGDTGDIPVTNAPEWLSQRLSKYNTNIETIPKETKTKTKTKTKTEGKGDFKLRKTITKAKDKGKLKSKNKKYKKTKNKKSKRIKSKNKKGGAGDSESRGQKRQFEGDVNDDGGDDDGGDDDGGGAESTEQTFDCDYNCGFKSEDDDEAVAHNLECPLRPLAGETEALKTLSRTSIPLLHIHENKNENCDIKADDDYNCSINSFSVIDNKFYIDDDDEHDYVITVEEPTRIYYGPNITEEMYCLRTNLDTAEPGLGTPLKDDTKYRTLNHNCLARNLDVIAAGRVKKIGNDLTFDNISGHYQGSLNPDKQAYIRGLVSMIQPHYTCDFEVDLF